MAMWRCPHCGTPQAETARCWVCRRSSTSCGTCRHFRASVAANVGYCGLDRQRRPISGDEIRACWESRPDPVDMPADVTASTFVRTPVPRREFIEVAEPVKATTDRPDRASQTAPPDPDPIAPVVRARWSLWEDAEA